MIQATVIIIITFHESLKPACNFDIPTVLLSDINIVLVLNTDLEILGLFVPVIGSLSSENDSVSDTGLGVSNVGLGVFDKGLGVSNEGLGVFDTGLGVLYSELYKWTEIIIESQTSYKYTMNTLFNIKDCNYIF